MGDFNGHVFPGSFFWLLGTWWVINIFKSFFNQKSKSKPSYQSQAYYLGPIGRFPIESAAKIAFAIVAITGEVNSGTKHWRFVHFVNIQHITMDLTIMLSGILDLIHYKKANPIAGTEPVGGLVLAGTLAIMFHFHLHGRTQLDITVHRLFVANILIFITCTMYEIWHKTHAVCSLARAVTIQTMSTWLSHIGIILYPHVIGMQPWDGNDVRELRLIYFIFAWHWLGNVVITLCIGCIVSITRTKLRNST